MNNSGLTPRQIVERLDSHIIGQGEAKRAVAIALRNRWRRQNVPEELADVDPARFARAVKTVSEAFGLPEAPAPDKVFTDKFLPPKADRMVAK